MKYMKSMSFAVDYISYFVYAALHVAVQNGHLNTVKSLLKHSSITAEAINMRLAVNTLK